MTSAKKTVNARDLLQHFNAVLGLSFAAPPDLHKAAQAAIDGCADWPMYGESERRGKLISLINGKLKLAVRS